MSRRVSKSIEELRRFIDTNASDVASKEKLTAEESDKIHFLFNLHIISVLTGTSFVEKKEKCVSRNLYVFNPIPNATEEREINILYDRYVKEIEPVLRKSSSNDNNEIAIIHPMRAGREFDLPDIEKVTGKKVEAVIQSALEKHLTKNDLITIRAIAERLRKRNRLFAIGIAILAVLGGAGAAAMINKSNSEKEYESVSSESDWDDDTIVETGPEDDVPEVIIDDDVPVLIA